jgi:hypothetical protein
MSDSLPEYPKTRDVSVIIPSNLDLRLDRLKHSLNFLYRNGHQGEAIVGIWGGHDKIDALQSFCAALSANIRIISQDADLRFTARVQEMADLTRGKYIVQTGDDDFLLPPTAQSLVNVLEQDPSVFAAQGRILTITLDEDPVFGLGTLPLWPAPEQDLLTRFARYCKHTGMTFHAMFRRADFIERYKWMDETMEKTKSHVWFDAMGEYFSIIKGRFVIVEEIFMLRGKHAANTSRIFRRDLADQAFPFFLLSEDFTPTYKVLEGQVLRLFASVGVDVMEPKTRKIILTGLLDGLQGGIYGRTDSPSPEDARLKAILKQDPPHPVLTSVLTMVVGTKVAPETP